MSLTGNMELKEMLDRKIRWKTVDDAQDSFKLSYVVEDEILTLEPQRIRVFHVTYSSTEQDTQTFLN